MNNTLLGKTIIRISIGFFILMIILNTTVLQMKVFPYFYSLPDGYPVEQMDYWMSFLLSNLKIQVLNSLLSLLCIYTAKQVDVSLDRRCDQLTMLAVFGNHKVPTRKISITVLAAGILMLLNGSVNVWILTDIRTLNLF